ncbi:MAG: ribonuclease HII [Pseudomonadota bacterium]
MPQILTAGVDEAGRGPLAGPVVAAAVILPDDHRIQGIDDSKKLSVTARQRLAVEIKARAVCFAIASCGPREIDELNILQASLLAMSRAIDSLSVVPTRALIDGNRCPTMTGSITLEAVVGGDGLHACIGAASILAKVHRDQQMLKLDRDFPEYGFARHKGYPTAQHREALRAWGPTVHHRKSYRPVREAIERAALHRVEEIVRD